MAVNIEEKMKENSCMENVMLGAGGLCFVVMAVFVMLHLGFMDENVRNIDKPIQFLSRNALWYLHIGLGLVGGILLDFRNPLIAAFSGMAAAVALTGSALLYLGWRDTILQVELIVPMLVALFVGVPINHALKRLFKPEKAEKSNEQGH